MSNYIRLFYMAVITYLCPNIDASSLTFVSKKRLLAITDKYVMQWKKIKVPQQHIQKDPVHWYCIDVYFFQNNSAYTVECRYNAVHS